MASLTELRREIEGKRQILAGRFAEGGADLDLNEEQVAEIQRMTKELDELKSREETLAKLADAERKNREAMEADRTPARPVPFQTTGAPEEPKAIKSLGELFTESAAYKAFCEERRTEQAIVLPYEFKANMTRTSGAGFVYQTQPTSEVVDYAVAQPRLVDIVPTSQTSEAAVTYFEETTFTNNAAPVAEAGAIPESALGYTKRTVPIEKVGTFIPVTEEELADAPLAQSRLNQRVPYMVRLAVDSQLAVGNGVTPQIFGLAGISGLTHQAKGGDSVPDAFLKAMTKINATVAFANADTIVMHPNDWLAVRMLQAADGIYIWGSPADPGILRMWGLPVVQSTAISENTGYIGDFRGFSELVYKSGLEVAISDSHSTNFVNDILVLKARIRCAMVWKRTTAFMDVTGI